MRKGGNEDSPPTSRYSPRLSSLLSQRAFGTTSHWNSTFLLGSGVYPSGATKERKVDVNTPLGRSVFVGRAQPLAELRVALDRAQTGQGQFVFVTGEPGIGKTRLAEEAAREARQRGLRALWGRCWEGDGAPAFWPWVQIVRAYMQQTDTATLASVMGVSAAALTQVVPEVQTRLPPLPLLPELTPEQARFRFFDSFTLFLKQAASLCPLLLILDDLHWADTPSLLLLQFLAHEIHNASVLIVCTYRDAEVDRAHPLSLILGLLARDSQRLSLSGLPAGEVARFLQEITGVLPSPQLVAFVHERTEGNPFFLSELVRLLNVEGQLEEHVQSEVFKQGRIPQGVRETLRLRLTRLTEECTRALSVAAVIGREFSFDVLAQVYRIQTDREWETLLVALQEALTVRILTDASGEGRRFRFSHVLIRETLYEDLPLLERVQLHRRVGETMETLYGTALQPYLSELADHFFKAEQSGAADKAIHYAVQAGECAATLLAYEEAANHYRRALELLAHSEYDEQQHCTLLLALGEVLSYAGEMQHSRETFLQAAAIARQLKKRDPLNHTVSLLARAALGLRTVWFVTGMGTVDAPLMSLLTEAGEALGEADSPLRARVLACLAAELRWSAPHAQRAALSEEAIAMARRLGDDPTLVYTLSARHWTLWSADNVEERLTVTSEMIRLAEKNGDATLALVGRTWRSLAWLESGERERSDADVERAATLAEKLHQPFYHWWASGQKTLRTLLEGRLEEAELCIYQHLQLGQQVQAPDAVQAFGIQMAILRHEQNRLQEMEAAFKEFADQYPTIPAWRCGLAGLYRELEKEAQAREEFEQIAARNFTDIPQDQQWLTALVLLSDVCAFLRDTHRAALLYELLQPYTNRVSIIGPGAACYGAVDRSLGLLAATLSLWDEASQHFDTALRCNERLHAKPFLVRTQYEYAQMLTTRDFPHSQERAHTLLTSALTTAQTLGLKRWEEKLQAQIDSAHLTTRSVESSSQKPTIKSSIPSTSDSRLRAADVGELNLFRLEGDYWSLGYGGAIVRLQDIKGLRHLVCLLREPGREFHVLDLLAMTDWEAASAPRSEFQKKRSSEGQERLDRQAKWAYQKRLIELREVLEEAQRFNDPLRAAKTEEEIAFLTSELAASYGMGWHARQRNEDIEKARKAVANRIRTALAKIKKIHLPLWRHLTISLKTGVFCSYNPEKPTSWTL